jgi:hypothetical protein
MISFLVRILTTASALGKRQGGFTIPHEYNLCIVEYMGAVTTSSLVFALAFSFNLSSSSFLIRHKRTLRYRLASFRAPHFVNKHGCVLGDYTFSTIQCH